MPAKQRNLSDIADNYPRLRGNTSHRFKMSQFTDTSRVLITAVHLVFSACGVASIWAIRPQVKACNFEVVYAFKRDSS